MITRNYIEVKNGINKTLIIIINTDTSKPKVYKDGNEYKFNTSYVGEYNIPTYKR